MKSLFFGIVLILLVGVAGFFYRNVSERGPAPVTACTMEAKVCPDGSAVGRTGPACEFARCAFPNVEDSVLGISFAVPPGYQVDDKGLLPNPESVRVNYALPVGDNTTFHTITVRTFSIPEGKTAEDVMLANTRRLTADMPVESMDDFSPVLINGRMFQSFVADRFEGEIVSYYYLPRSTDVLRFDVVERGVDWTNPELVVEKLPQHAALLKMLGTLETQP